MILSSHRAIWLLVSILITIRLTATSPESCLLFSITKQQTARLGVVNTSNRLLELEITNSSSEIFFSKSISGNQNFFQLLDLAKMPGGEYSVKLTGLDKSYEKRFMVTSATIQLMKEVNETPPVFRMLDDETITISYFNSKKDKINILLESGDDDVIFEEKGIFDLALSKKYSLKNLPRGEYTAKLSSGSKTYSFPIFLK
jgi:hypothetical protein